MPKPPPTPFAPIGASKINCTGFSTSSSTKTSPACAKAMAPKTWPSSDTSPSISLEMPSNQFDNAQGSVARRQSHERLKKPASNSAENSQDGTTHTSKPSLPLKPVNLDSEPWRNPVNALRLVRYKPSSLCEPRRTSCNTSSPVFR